MLPSSGEILLAAFETGVLPTGSIVRLINNGIICGQGGGALYSWPNSFSGCGGGGGRDHTNSLGGPAGYAIIGISYVSWVANGTVTGPTQ